MGIKVGHHLSSLLQCDQMSRHGPNLGKMKPLAGAASQGALRVAIKHCWGVSEAGRRGQVRCLTTEPWGGDVCSADVPGVPGMHIL